MSLTKPTLHHHCNIFCVLSNIDFMRLSHDYLLILHDRCFTLGPEFMWLLGINCCNTWLLKVIISVNLSFLAPINLSMNMFVF